MFRLGRSPVHARTRGGPVNNKLRLKYKGNSDALIPGIRQFKTSPELEEIVKAVTEVMGEKENLARQVGMYLCHKYGGKKLRDIGDLFGVGETAIAEARRLLTRKIEKDQQLSGEVEKVKVVLGIDIWSVDPFMFFPRVYRKLIQLGRRANTR